jgi:hypothetical protein
MGGNTSSRFYHSFGACVSSYSTCFKLSLEQFVWFICYYGVYDTMSMFYICRVEHYACLLMNL